MISAPKKAFFSPRIYKRQLNLIFTMFFFGSVGIETLVKKLTGESEPVKFYLFQPFLEDHYHLPQGVLTAGILHLIF